MSKIDTSWQLAPSHGFGPPPHQDGYRIVYRYCPLTRDLQFRYVPEGK